MAGFRCPPRLAAIAATILVVDLITKSVGLIQIATSAWTAADLMLFRSGCDYRFEGNPPPEYSSGQLGNVGTVWFSVRSGCGRLNPRLRQYLVESDGSWTPRDWMTNYTDKDAGSRTEGGREFYEVKHDVPGNTTGRDRVATLDWPTISGQQVIIKQRK